MGAALVGGAAAGAEEGGASVDDLAAAGVRLACGVTRAAARGVGWAAARARADAAARARLRWVLPGAEAGAVAA